MANPWFRNYAATAAANTAGTGDNAITSASTGGGVLVTYMDKAARKRSKNANGQTSVRYFCGSDFIDAYKKELREVFPLDRNVPGFNIGGGAIGFLSKNTGLRFDFRYYSSFTRYDEAATFDGPLHIRYMTASVGLVLRR